MMRRVVPQQERLEPAAESEIGHRYLVIVDECGEVIHEAQAVPTNPRPDDEIGKQGELQFQGGPELDESQMVEHDAVAGRSDLSRRWGAIVAGYSRLPGKLLDFRHLEYQQISVRGLDLERLTRNLFDDDAPNDAAVFQVDDIFQIVLGFLFWQRK